MYQSGDGVQPVVNPVVSIVRSSQLNFQRDHVTMEEGGMELKSM